MDECEVDADLAGLRVGAGRATGEADDFDEWAGFQSAQYCDPFGGVHDESIAAVFGGCDQRGGYAAISSALPGVPELLQRVCDCGGVEPTGFGPSQLSAVSEHVF